MHCSPVSFQLDTTTVQLKFPQLDLGMACSMHSSITRLSFLVSFLFYLDPSRCIQPMLQHIAAYISYIPIDEPLCFSPKIDKERHELCDSQSLVPYFSHIYDDPPLLQYANTQLNMLTSFHIMVPRLFLSCRKRVRRRPRKSYHAALRKCGLPRARDLANERSSE